jgi:hypothetical protein
MLGRYIGKETPVAWPPVSSDLTSLDVFPLGLTGEPSLPIQKQIFLAIESPNKGLM